MPPEHLRFGGGAAESALNPLVAIWMLAAIVLILALPRGKAITPFLLAFFTIPVGQVVVLGAFHFTVLRILILAVLARRLTFPRRDKYPGGYNGVDQAVILWTISAGIAFFLEFPGKAGAIQMMGSLLDTLGGYLAVRSLISDDEAVRRTIKTMAAICAILGACMINEQISHINVFGLLEKAGGVTVRNGEIRSGASLGCIYAGAFSGVLIPLFFWIWKDGRSKMIACTGLLGATVMVITSHSSTSSLALMGSAVGLAFWPLRKKMLQVRWGLVCTLVVLHLSMKAPVWALIARIDLTGSSSGDHRYKLVDMTIKHFRDWWLIGTPDFVNWGWDSWDLCNQFVAVALTGGLLTLIFYIAIFTRSFGIIGNARKRVSGDRRQELKLWCFGSTLFATVVAHFGINYMAQLIMGLLPLLACISVVASEAKRATVRVKKTNAAAEMESEALVARPGCHPGEIQQMYPTVY
jgi:hypothetical protein